MTVDISKVFKANVKAIRVSLGDEKDKKDALNEELLGGRKTVKKDNVSEIKKITSQVLTEAKNISKNVTILKEFLLENKKSYVQPNHLLNQQNEETDWQAYEEQAEAIVKKCADSIKQLKEKAFNANNLSAQLREHFQNVFFLLEKYLKDVCKIYSEQKAIRIKRIIEMKSFSQLCTPELLETNKFKQSFSSSKLIVDQSNENLPGRIENELTPQELQAFEDENELLYDDLNSQIQEVKRIESEVIEVSRLTQIFAENIVSQLSTIESVQKSAVETNSNLNLGNEHIKEAMKKGAALRLWILFIIVVLSFTLLFLDWYND